MIPYTAPSEPTNLTAVALSHRRVRVTWEPVSDNGGAQVDVYKLVVTGPDGSSLIVQEFPSIAKREYVVDNLVNNTNYM